MPGLNARLSPAAFPLRHPLQRSSARLRTEALQRTSPLMRESLVAPWPVAGVRKKKFLE
jgi:hypothetical protein